ncbi:MAG: hypothetical protein HOE53_02435 [Candidatus Magasanikbacteria bacterium]|jgi:hypothetical protein|nr:hypothetical protein [Candidatus Magasanikbacteria bacterium]
MVAEQEINTQAGQSLKGCIIVVRHGARDINCHLLPAGEEQMRNLGVCISEQLGRCNEIMLMSASTPHVLHSRNALASALEGTPACSADAQLNETSGDGPSNELLKRYAKSFVADSQSHQCLRVLVMHGSIGAWLIIYMLRALNMPQDIRFEETLPFATGWIIDPVNKTMRPISGLRH